MLAAFVSIVGSSMRTTIVNLSQRERSGEGKSYEFNQKLTIFSCAQVCADFNHKSQWVFDFNEILIFQIYIFSSLARRRLTGREIEKKTQNRPESFHVFIKTFERANNSVGDFKSICLNFDLWLTRYLMVFSLLCCLVRIPKLHTREITFLSLSTQLMTRRVRPSSSASIPPSSFSSWHGCWVIVETVCVYV